MCAWPIRKKRNITVVRRMVEYQGSPVTSCSQQKLSPIHNVSFEVRRVSITVTKSPVEECTSAIDFIINLYLVTK